MIRLWTSRRAWGGYLVAILIPIAAAGVRLAFLGVLGQRATYVTFYPAVTLVVLFGGLGPGLLATGLSALLANWFWIEPTGQLSIPDPGDAVGMVIFLGSCALISLVGDAMHRAQARAREAQRRSDESLRHLGVATTSTPPRVVPVFAAVAAVTLCSTLLVWALGLRVSSANEEVARSREILAGLEDTLSTLKDAETGQRGFLLTGDEKYLQPYQAALTHVEKDLTRLQRWAATGDVSKELAGEANRLIGELLDELKETIELRRQKGPEAALAVVRSDVGKRTMDELRARVAAMETEEHQDLAHWQARRERATWQRTALALIAAAVELAFLLWAFRRIGDEIGRAGGATAEAHRERELLSVTLASIGDAVIVTDTQGRVTYLNKEAERLTGWTHAQAEGQPLVEVFNIVNEQTRLPVESPAEKVLRRGAVIGLANHTVLIARDGRQVPIDDSGAPVRGVDGHILGVVLVFRDFSEQRKTERELQESEDRFRTMANAIPQLAWMAQADGYIFWYNRRWFEYTGTTIEQMQGWGWQSVHDPDMLPKVMERWQASIATSQPFDMEFPLRGADGQFRWFLTRVMPMKDADGRVVRWFGTNTDISEKRESEAALRESEELRRLGQEVARIGSFDWNIRTGVNVWTTELEAMHGLPPGGFPKTQPAWEQLVHPEDRAGAVAAVQRAFETSETVEHEWRVVWPDGSVHWLAGRFRVLRDEAGNPLRLTGVNIDITARKLADTALHDSEQRYRSFVQASSQVVWTTNAVGEVDFDIPAWQAFVGQTSEEARGFGWMNAIRAEDRPRVAEAWRKASESRTIYEVEYRLRRHDGEWRNILARGVPILNADGTIREYIGTCIDITERKRAEEALRRAKESAEAAQISAEHAKTAAETASKAKDHFLAVLSHELRTPLTPVLATISMLQEHPQLDADTREQLEMVRRNVELEARLIDDLLDVTRIERGKVELDRRPIELCTILHRAAEVCMPDIEARRLEFGIAAPDGPYLVEADAARLQQVFWNLIKNAVKFTPHGGCVGVRCHHDGDGHVIAEVNDSGEGIAPEVLPRLFNAFEQGERNMTRQFGGLGLGLAISKALVELHGGTLTAASPGRGKGATFTVRMPLVVRSDAPRAVSGPKVAPTAAVAEAAASPAQNGLRILLVEDHGDTSRIMKRLLERAGHQVTAAGDVATALTLAGQEAFDLLISDLGLPDRSGLELMRELRARGQTLPGIALSGYGQESDLKSSRDAGFAAHLVKPVNLQRLSEVVASVTDHRA